MACFRSGSPGRSIAALILGLLGLAGVSPRAQAQQGPGGPEVLARGPIHEAFASPVGFNPTLGVVVPKPPPSTQIEEQPPAEKPPGANVEWIPGYWAWDDERNDYLWISGIWRDIPPGRQWVPGYWGEVAGGFRWTSGFWAPLAVNGQLNYLPTPPQSIEVGPNSPQPGPDFFWSPGSWAWFENRYVWRPGYWVQAQPNWIWVPPSYAPTASGYVYIDGYWDYPVARRGLPFAPVYFGPAYYAQPVYAYQPSIVLSVGGLTASLFIRPSYNHYYFGDYYGPAALGPRGGYVPWFAYQQQRIGYDPLYASMAAQNHNRPEWVRQIRTEYQYRVEHVEARPAPTFEKQRVQLEQRKARGEDVRGLELAHPINQSINHPETNHRLVPVQEEHRAELAARQNSVREAQQNRAKVEAAARIPANVRPEQHAPKQLEIPRSPVASSAEPRAQNRGMASPPPHPEPHQAFRPTLAGESHREPGQSPNHAEPLREAKQRPAHNEPKGDREEHRRPQ